MNPINTRNSFAALILISLLINTAVMAQIGEFENSTSIQTKVLDNRARYNETDQTYKIDLFKNDAISDQFIWRSIQGDFILRAEVLFSNSSRSPISAGWLICNTISDESSKVLAEINKIGQASLTTGELEVSQDIRISDATASVIQLERKGEQIIMSVGKFGQELQEMESTIVLKNEIFAGLYASAEELQSRQSVSFRNVRITIPQKETQTSYQDYLGSRLEILDVTTGHRKVLTTSGHSIQAPNWTPDGRTLIYNSNGYLYKYDLATDKISLLNTGFADRNNNDHVLSADGKKIAISHFNNDNNGESTIYYLPIDGSDHPTRVTKPNVGHSFLHGWSTDERFMIFTGRRNDKYDLIQVEVATGNEIQLTDTSGLDDGSEYSPDGNYIYFNSTRSGMMKIYRMQNDGSNPEQLTFGSTWNDWFPHVSPNQDKVLFISYNNKVDPADHPFYKQVTLRMMDYNGGDTEIVAYLYGGQGSINVPSWSPDNKKVAFVSNTRFY